MYLNESNLQIMIGYMAFNPEVKLLNNQNKLLTFKISVSERIKARDGTQKNITHYIECKAWGKLAENIASKCAKGDFMQIAGKCVVESWTDNNTQKKVYKQICEAVSFKNFSKIIGGSGSAQNTDDDQSYAGGGFGSSGVPSGGFDNTPFGSDIPPAPDFAGEPEADDGFGGLV